MGYIGADPALNESVTSAQIADDAIIAAKIASSAVTTAKINADAVTNAKIADGQVDTEHLAALAVETAKIAASQVTSAKLNIDAGIAFPASASAQGDANTLDDYEEGTFTVSFTTGSGSITIDTNIDTFSYTKIGRTVHIQGSAKAGSVSSPSGDMSLRTLPFAVGALTENSEAGSMAIFGEQMDSTVPQGIAVLIHPGENWMTIRENGTTGYGNDLADHFEDGSHLYISGTYLVA